MAEQERQTPDIVAISLHLGSLPATIVHPDNPEIAGSLFRLGEGAKTEVVIFSSGDVTITSPDVSLNLQAVATVLLKKNNEKHIGFERQLLIKPYGFGFTEVSSSGEITVYSEKPPATLETPSIQMESQKEAETDTSPTPSYQDFFFNPAESAIFVDEKRIPLTPTEHRLLDLFIMNPNRLLLYDELRLHKENGIRLSQNVLKAQIMRLREKIANGREDRPSPIVTREGFGYRFMDPSKPVPRKIVYQTEKCAFDDMNKCLIVDTGEVDLTPTEYRLFSTLANQPGRIVDSNTLLDSAGIETQIGLRARIHWLRKKLPGNILQAQGNGYSLI